MRKFILFAITLLIIFPTCFCRDFSVAKAAPVFRNDINGDGKLIIVVDPGHGGTSQGAFYKNTDEAIPNMVIARALKEELEKYEGVTVYLTHESTDETLYIINRVQNAARKKADLYISIHLNAKADHDLFGCEAWVPFQNEKYNRQAFTMAALLLPKLEEMGIYNRGIKVRRNDEGGEYYGVMRFSGEQKVCSFIVEHCHMDYITDEEFWDSDEDLKAMGVSDATALAQYFGLSSSVLGVSYADFDLTGIDYAKEFYEEDLTRPDMCQISVVSSDENGSVTLAVEAFDEQTPILYYAVSRDGGLSFDITQRWPEASAMGMYSPRSAQITVDNVNVDDKLMVKVYNKYDVTRLSNIEDMTLYLTDRSPQVPYVENRIEELRKKRYMITAVIILLAVLAVLILLIGVLRLRKKYKKLSKKKRKSVTSLEGELKVEDLNIEKKDKKRERKQKRHRVEKKQK